MQLRAFLYLKQLLLLLFLLSSLFLKAQVVADFTSAQDTGCVPFVAGFLDNSTGAITYRHWDFGNGNVATGNKISTSAIYNTSGVYDVTLTVSNGIDTAIITKSALIHVLSLPTANFNNQALVAGCAEFDFSVSDNSSPGDLPISNWLWDFDDGSPRQSGQSVTHSYRNPGVYAVTVIVSDSLGCSNSFEKSSLVTVLAKPEANFFSSDSLTVCGPPLTVNITNSSTSSTALTYQWNFGGTTSTNLNMSNTFTNSGGYDAELIVTNTVGCKDTLFIPNYVWIGQIVANMNIVDTACIDVATEMINSSSGGNVFSWDFGDGAIDVGDTVEHIYTNPGLHTVTLVSSSGATCDDTVTQDVFIEKVEADFSSTPNFACEVPLFVQFTDLSPSNTVMWEWHFGNPLMTPTGLQSNISLLQNPSNVYENEGKYDDTLYIESSNGCKDSLIKVINENIILTQAAFSTSKTEGCTPLSVNFFNETDSVSRMAYWVWDFDDGTPNSTTFSPNHIFTIPGEYMVDLMVVSIMGCSTRYEMEIAVGSRQTANFTVDTNTACGLTDTVSFTNLSTDTSLINSYSWFFGDGESMGDSLVSHAYLDTGYMEVTLIVKYNGCPDTLTIDSAIHISGPVSSFRPVYRCDSQNVVTFDAETKGGTNFYWNFGDSSAIDSINWNPSHTYLPTDSAWAVSLVVYDSISGCELYMEEQTRVIYLDGKLEAQDTTICKDMQILFNTGNSVNAISSVKWSIDNLSLSISGSTNQKFGFPFLGPHTVYAEVSDAHFCKDTVSVDVVVYQPEAQFSVSTNSGCTPLNVQFNDLSTSVGGISRWYWNFGNGNTSTLQSPTQVFNGNGTTSFDISLLVADIYGCINRFDTSGLITAIEPPSYFTSTDIEVCANSPVTFQNQVPGSYTYKWYFGDGDSSVFFNPIHAYAAGNYDVSLTVTDGQGCDSTFIEPAYIDVQSIPNANFGASPQISNCYPASVTFTDSSNYPNVGFFTWNFGDSPNYVMVNGGTTQNLYNLPGLYDITFIVTSTYGCTDTIVKTSFVNIGGPTGDITFQPNIGCMNEVVGFDVVNINSDAQRFIWDFGDGVVDTSFATNIAINHVYTTDGFYNVSVLLSNLQGTCQISDTATVEIDKVVSDFALSDSSGCAPFEFNVVNLSIGEDELDWYLDGVNISDSSTQSFVVGITGSHEIKLIVKSTYSQCLDTLIQKVTVFPKPNVKANEDAVICIGDSLQLWGKGANFYKWSPAIWLNTDSIFNPISVPDSGILYHLAGIDTNGCENRDSIYITVQQKPVLEWITPDTSIFIGEELQLNTITNSEMIYLWQTGNTLGCIECPNPFVEPTESITYTLTYGDAYGCFSFDTTVFVEVKDEFKVFIPNTFTPEGDGLNDTFAPVTYGIEELEFMKIYDRWGTLVYQTTDITQGWDGKVNGQISNHNTVYTYTIRVRRYNLEYKDYVGAVLLLTRDN